MFFEEFQAEALTIHRDTGFLSRAYGTELHDHMALEVQRWFYPAGKATPGTGSFWFLVSVRREDARVSRR